MRKIQTRKTLRFAMNYYTLSPLDTTTNKTYERSLFVNSLVN
jgi:hypothetical protein